VAGGVLLVIPNLMGIFTWSPPLDQWGNSSRGVQFCEVRTVEYKIFDIFKISFRNIKSHQMEVMGIVSRPLISIETKVGVQFFEVRKL
jgi:glutaminase